MILQEGHRVHLRPTHDIQGKHSKLHLRHKDGDLAFGLGWRAELLRDMGRDQGGVRHRLNSSNGRAILRVIYIPENLDGGHLVVGLVRQVRVEGAGQMRGAEYILARVLEEQSVGKNIIQGGVIYAYGRKNEYLFEYFRNYSSDRAS